MIDLINLATMCIKFVGVTLKDCKGDAFLESVLDIYKDDLSKLELEAQLPLPKLLCKDVCNELSNNVLSELSVPAFLVCGKL